MLSLLVRLLIYYKKHDYVSKYPAVSNIPILRYLQSLLFLIC